MSMSPETPATSSYVTRFFGGPPLSVIFRLLLLSILIGVILEVLGLDPWNVIDSLRRPDPARLGHGFRRGALALALPALGCGAGGADLAGRARHAPCQRAMIGERRIGAWTPRMQTLDVF
jgi:hypothetical protein